MTSTESRHLSMFIDRPVGEVYAFASDPANLSRWAPGIGGPVVRVDGAWFVETPAGRTRVTFAPANAYGVLDHEILTPGGETVYVPLRVIADGEGCEVVFTLRRLPGMTDGEFERDSAAVSGDLGNLKKLLESGGDRP
nr:SRPBCC family protein [Micromonospora sp. DSM 115978]